MAAQRGLELGLGVPQVTEGLMLLLHTKPRATKMRQLNENDARYCTSAAADRSSASEIEAGEDVCCDPGQIAG